MLPSFLSGSYGPQTLIKDGVIVCLCYFNVLFLYVDEDVSVAPSTNSVSLAAQFNQQLPLSSEILTSLIAGEATALTSGGAVGGEEDKQISIVSATNDSSEVTVATTSIANSQM